MNMSLRLYILVGFVVASTVAQAGTRTWALSQGHSFKLDFPDGTLIEQIAAAPEAGRQAFTVRLPDRNNQSTIAYQVTVLPIDPSVRWETVADIDGFLKRIGQDQLKRSIETEVAPVHLRMKHGFGSYAAFTDPDLVNKVIEAPKVYRHLIMGAARVGNYVILVRGYTNSLRDYYFTRMNQILEGATVQ